MKAFPNYRILEKNDTFYVEKEIFKNKWISLYKLYMNITFLIVGIFSILIISLAIFTDHNNLMVFLIFNGLIIIPLLEINRRHKHSFISDASQQIKDMFVNYNNKIYKKEKRKLKSQAKYYSVNISSNNEVDVKEYDKQEIRKEKLLRLQR